MIPSENKPITAKKPGRPKKKADVPIVRHGIVAKAEAGRRVSFEYNNPAMFRKIVHLHKTYAARELELNFTPHALEMSAVDHLEKSTIYTTIDGKAMISYYCGATTRIRVDRSKLDPIFSVVGRNHKGIIVFLKEEDYRSRLYIDLIHAMYGNVSSYEIDLTYKDNEPAVVDNDADYPLKFTLTKDHFKNTITTIGNLSDSIILQKNKEEPLRITCDKEQGISLSGAYSDTSKMDFVCTLAADDMLAVSVSIAYIKPLPKSNVGEEVRVAVDKERKISLTTTLDKIDGIGPACCLKIYTEIKTDQPSVL